MKCWIIQKLFSIDFSCKKWLKGRKLDQFAPFLTFGLFFIKEPMIKNKLNWL